MKLVEFKQQGSRKNNEDFHGHNENIVIVCDGIGGHVSGEVASNFIVSELLESFSSFDSSLSKNYIQEKIVLSQQNLNKLLIESPELEKMGTTLTLVVMSKFAWYAAHIGDSRIYLFRPSEKKFWHTWDHSFVGELVRANEITREAGRFHPMSNRVARAIIANSENKISKADIAKFDEIKEGDIFLLCSDGVIEAWGDHELCELMCNPDLDLNKKCETIRVKCDEQSKDNNTAYFVEIEKQDEILVGKNQEIKWITMAEVIENYKLYLKKIAEENPKNEIESDIPLLETADTTTESNEAITSQKRTKKTGNGRKKKMTNILLFTLFFMLIAFAVWQMVKPKEDDKPQLPGTSSSQTNANSGSNTSSYSSESDPKPLPEERKAWQEAVHKNTIESYEKYLGKYKNGKYANDAKNRITTLKDDIAWNETDSIKSIPAYEKYVNDFPTGKHIEQAKNKISLLDDSLFSDVKKANTIAEYQRYLKICPNGKHKEEARVAIKTLSKLPESIIPTGNNSQDTTK